MRRPHRDHLEGREGQGEVIEISVSPASLTDLDSSEELLQSGWWGSFKQEHGWSAHPFSVKTETEAETEKQGAAFGLLVLTRVFLRRFRIAYVPFGPTFDPVCGRQEFLSSLAQKLRPHLPEGTLFLRFDLPWEKSGESPGVRKSPSDIQPPSTVIVDISGTPDEILAAMKPKTRYNVRLAEKKGVTVAEEGESFPAWYALYQETSRRDRIAIHSPSYYRGLFTSGRAYAGKGPVVTLLAARHEGELLAGNICIFWKKRGIYLTGASSNAKRNLMPTYALQWDAIRRAKDAGCSEYDLYGIPPRPDESQPMFGLYQFKTGFSDRILERWGTWDVPYRPGLCLLYRTAEMVRLYWFRSVRKRFRRR